MKLLLYLGDGWVAPQASIASYGGISLNDVETIRKFQESKLLPQYPSRLSRGRNISCSSAKMTNNPGDSV